MSLRMGVPTIAEVAQIAERPSYQALADYSKHYVAANEPLLRDYRWIKDAFRQWSRLCEYPYCYEEITQKVPPSSTVLDAGSGLTFFPFLMSAMYQVTCADVDDYGQIFAQMNAAQRTNVAFVRAEISNIPCPTATFDCIYCISVLEHTANRREILKEFRRLLKPNGVLVFTFDVSLNSNSLGISTADAEDLLNTARSYFDIPYETRDLLEELRRKDCYTTRYVAERLPYDLLPWPRPTMVSTIKDLLRGREIVSRANLAFCMVSGKARP
jgi:SAM-dependent methyltransferase